MLSIDIIETLRITLPVIVSNFWWLIMWSITNFAVLFISLILLCCVVIWTGAGWHHTVNTSKLSMPQRGSGSLQVPVHVGYRWSLVSVMSDEWEWLPLLYYLNVLFSVFCEFLSQPRANAASGHHLFSHCNTVALLQLLTWFWSVCTHVAAVLSNYWVVSWNPLRKDLGQWAAEQRYWPDSAGCMCLCEVFSLVFSHSQSVTCSRVQIYYSLCH